MKNKVYRCACGEWNPKENPHTGNGMYCRGKLKCQICMCEMTEHESEDDEEEAVNHPSHYQGKGMESIQVIEAFELNFCLGNAVKYILRAGKKENKKKDLQKAIWYLNRELEQLE